MAYQENGSGAILSTAQSITTSAASTNVFDVTGAGVGVLPTMIGAGNVNTALGTDLGTGQGVAHPGVLFEVTTTGTGTGTIAFAIQAAPDSGTGTEGTYTTLTQSAAAVGTTLVAGGSVYLPLPPVPSNYSGLPRFYRAYYVQTGNGAVSVSAQLLMNPPDIKSVLQFGRTYTSAY